MPVETDVNWEAAELPEEIPEPEEPPPPAVIEEVVPCCGTRSSTQTTQAACPQGGSKDRQAQGPRAAQSQGAGGK